MTPTFRPATIADVSALAVLVDIAGDGMASYMWRGLAAPGQSPLEIGRERARREEGGFSYRNATIAELDGEIAAGLVGYRLQEPYDTGGFDAMPDLVRPLVLLESKVPGSWYVNILATFPEFRGQGIASRLLAIAEEKARAAQAPSLSVIVTSWNGNAARLYTKAGYTPDAREPALPFPGCLHKGDWVLMVKPLAV
ncbi:MAG: GNAT family N-acetyltransferase [Alphaproteobacteria bacterium]|nr:GNAT family N-acetyltransferase [Alphaproteobacteria bacterium]